MRYRVRADLNFIEYDEANDFYHDCEKALAKSQPINPGQPNQEIALIVLEECHHDETPAQACLVLKEETLP